LFKNEPDPGEGRDPARMHGRSGGSALHEVRLTHWGQRVNAALGVVLPSLGLSLLRSGHPISGTFFKPRAKRRY